MAELATSAVHPFRHCICSVQGIHTQGDMQQKRNPLLQRDTLQNLKHAYTYRVTHCKGKQACWWVAEIPLEALIDDDVDSSLDLPVTESRDDDMESVAAEPPKQKAAVAIKAPSQSASQMDEEAGKKGYGKAYAAFGGGREGLEACAASMHSLLLHLPAHLHANIVILSLLTL